MLANVTAVSLKNFSTAHGTFAERFFACEINFCDRFLRFSVLFRFRVALLEFEADVFLIGQHEKRFERPALSRNEPFEQVGLAGREQFLHLFALDRPLQDHFARPEIARLVRPNGIFAEVAHSRFENASVAFRTFPQRLLCGKVYLLSRAIFLAVWSEIKFGLEIVAQFKCSMEPFAFPAAKTAEWPGLSVA